MTPRLTHLEALHPTSPYICKERHMFPYPPHIHATPFTGNSVEEGDTMAIDREGHVHHLRVLWEAK